MYIDKVEYELGWLKLRTGDRLTRFLNSFKEGDYDIVPHKEKRSNNANAYAWALIGQIASKMHVSPEEVYIHCIENIGGKTTVVSVADFAVADFKNAFIHGHIGRKVDIIGEHDGMKDLLVTYGSSDYNVAQMSELLESVISECDVLGIEHRPRDYIDQLVSEWEKSQKTA